MDELKKEAKELGIPHYWTMSEDTLIDKIKDAKDKIVDAVEETVEAVEAIGVATGAVTEVVNEVDSIKRDPAKCADVLKHALTLKRYLGEQSVEYLKHVSCYRDFIPDEYKKAKHNIEIWL